MRLSSSVILVLPISAIAHWNNINWAILFRLYIYVCLHTNTQHYAAHFIPIISLFIDWSYYLMWSKMGDWPRIPNKSFECNAIQNNFNCIFVKYTYLFIINMFVALIGLLEYQTIQFGAIKCCLLWIPSIINIEIIFNIPITNLMIGINFIDNFCDA